ncbi:MAG: hypothetical protein JWP01_2105 [Myxococcales bacterium]|nr:hypothetical protein [Myxococcales bacterium]
MISALGKSGEPRAHRPVTVGLVHRWSRMQVNLELATDAHGRIELGHLPGISRISATLGTVTPTWWIEDHLGSFGIQSRAGKDVVIPLSPSRTAAEVIRRMSLVETNGVPVHHPQVTLVALEDSVTIRGLRAGEYQLRAPGIGQVSIVVLDVRAEIRSIAFTPGEVGELSRSAPAIAEITTRDDLRIRLVTPGERTRVHVIATTFAPSLLELPWIGPRGVGRRSDRARGATYVSGRELGDEYRYILDRRSAKRYPGLLLERPSLLLNPWSRRTTTTDVATARAGGVFASAAQMSAGHVGSAPEAKATAPANTEAFASYDFLGAPPAVLANLCPDADGVVTVPRTALGSAASVIIIVDDPAGTMVRYIALPETTLEPRDLRLRLALDPARHATQRKAIQPLRAGEHLVIEDLATAKVHLVDSVERAHAYLLALREDATLRELSFITRWHQLPDHERRERYSKYACHELHLFLYFKDRAFFDAVVAPYLAHKRTKTFVDHWLLGANLSTYLEPRQLMRLNAVERALLARRMQAGDAIGRILGDEVAVLPPDPNLDTRLIDGLLGASTLDGDEGIATAHADAFEMAEESYPSPMASMAGPDGGGFGSARPAAPPPAAPRRPAAKTMQREQAKKKSDSRGRAADDDFADHDGEAEAPTPMYRTVDKTQEWAETNWWQRTPAQSTASMIQPNRLWRDLAEHRDGPFLSPGLGLATGSFAEAMCALAVTDLAFVAPSHTITPEGPRLTIAAAGNALAGSSQLVDGELITGGAPLVVGMSFVRSDDRHDWVNGEQVDKYVDGPFATGVVYTCLVVLANPTSSRQRIAALVQVPRGSIPVAGARATQTIDVVLEPYGTHGHEYSFYFPAPGTWSQFPVHVSRAGTIVAAAPGGTLEVVSGGATADPRSWPYISQRAPLVELTTYLATANLKAIDLSRMAWRLRDRTAYHQIISVLEQRRAFDATAWGYSLQHGDAPRIRVFLRSLDAQLLAAGPVLDMLGLDAEDLDAYEHLEHAPLINARAHRLGPKLRILNDGLAAQYTRFLELVSHRASPTAEDLLAATAYLLAQDRLEAALAMFARVDPSKLADRMQHDYLAAFTACIAGDLGRARHLATPWRELPVDRWRHRFAALLAMLDELDGIAPAAVIDPRSRDQQHAELASRQPTFDLALGREGIVIRSSHIAALELRFFEMDIELLFSRQPFVQSDVSRFSFIEPGHREHLEQLAPEQRVPWPAALRGKNVVVEAVGAGQRKAKVHYANDLSTTVSNQVGQIRVSRASDHASLPATYVKVYARKQGGQVTFYKDGYTDLRGWFEYATLSTTDLDHVERFAILVCSDQAGAAILEASPPTR